MKKLLILVLIVCLMFTAAACSCRINIKTEREESAEKSSSETSDSEDEDITEDTEEIVGPSGSTYHSNEQSSGGNLNSNQGGEQRVETIASPTIPTISFPYAIPGTSLVIQQVSSYSGYFIEDASDRDVSGIVAIALTNNGDDLDFVGIGISQGDRSLGFSGSQIPANSTVIIQEQTGAAYSSESYYSATATIQPAKFELSEDLVSVQDNGNGTFSVINISEERLAEVKVYFKNYLPDEDVYVGGITYSVTLNDIEPGTAVEVNASHYDVNYSVFVKIYAER